MECLHLSSIISLLNCAEGGGKNLGAREDDDTRQTVSSDTHKCTESVAAYTLPTEIYTRWGLSTKRRKWSRAPIPNQETLFKKDTLTKGKLVFFTGISLGRLTILKNGLMLSNTWPTQTQWYFNRFFICFILLSLVISVSLNFVFYSFCFDLWVLFLFVCVSFLCFLFTLYCAHFSCLFICLYQNREQRHGFEMVGGGEDGEEVGEEKCDQNILYKIINFNRQKIHQVKKRRESSCTYIK